MRVFKFGGASVKDSASIQNVATIIEKYGEGPLLVVISAMGKTTNALEAVCDAYFQKDGTANQKLDAVKQAHFQVLGELFEPQDEVYAAVNDTFVEIDWILEDDPEESYDYLYDQIVSIGEFLSTKVIAAFLNSRGLACQWLDARDVILTDNTYREARVDWTATEKNMLSQIPGMLEKGIVLTQGFIGGTSENFTTTLGREGSDYTAAIFSTCLNADSMTVWKDVPGILSADPKLFKNVTKINRLSFQEAIEMTYYGAKVIHPKTIKPLQNKSIPLYVKSFVDPSGEGTQISGQPEIFYPPVVVVEKNQILIQISSTDFSFIAEHHLSMIFAKLAEARLKVNMMQNSAISFSVCVDHKPRRVANFLDSISNVFEVKKDPNLELVTVRHYKEEVIYELKKGKIVVLEERIRNTFQMVVKDIPVMERVQ